MTSPRSGATVPTGAHPGNTGGKKGRSGRKSKDFIKRCLEARSDPTLWAAARKRNAVAVLQMAAEYTESKPAQKIHATTKLIVEVVRE